MNKNNLIDTFENQNIEDYKKYYNHPKNCSEFIFTFYYDYYN